jgi:hypothetical protein
MAEIERENRILLEKIANIMVSGGQQEVQKSTIESAREDSESPNRSIERVMPRRVLLNKRQRDLLRLNEENMVGLLLLTYIYRKYLRD